MEGKRFVAEGPDGEALILSSWVAQPRLGTNSADHLLEPFLDKLVENAKDAALNAAGQPGLTIMRPLSAAAPAGGIFPCWTLVAHDPEVFFAEAIIRGPSAVMLATYEATISAERVAQFESFLSSFGFPLPRA